MLDGAPLAWINRVVTRVDVESFQGLRAIYHLTYDNQTLTQRSCKDGSSATSATIRVPRLVRVDMPDGTFYSMQDTSGSLYHRTCHPQIDDLPGVIKQVELPTGGKLAWAYQNYEFPPGDNSSVFNTSAGVASRSLLRKNNTTHGVWTYKTTPIGAEGNNDAEMRTEVVYPTDDCSKHYFNARYWVTPSEGRGWEYGLPFTYTASSGNAFLSTQIFVSNDGAGSCRGSSGSPQTPLRSTYLRFRRDQLPGTVCHPVNPAPGCPTLADWQNRNRQVDVERVVFHDDGNRWINTAHSQFDGLGHFRRTVRTGTLWSGTTNELSTATTNFNRSTGTYPGSYQSVPTTEAWVLGIFDATTVTVPEAHGEITRKVEFGFERSNGHLFCTRVLASGNQRGADDLIGQFGRNASGEVTSDKTFGGDLQTLSVAGANCGAIPAQPVYQVNRTYQFGRLRTARPIRPNGTPGPFMTTDVDLDPSSGLVVASRDPSGLETRYEYDRSARLTRMETPRWGVLETGYSNATQNAPMKVVQTMMSGGDSTIVRHEEVQHDDFGRPVLRRRRMPGGAWSEQQTQYNARGWVTSRSQAGNLSRRTLYLGHDPFGRPTTIRPPDGSAHDTRIAYAGVGQISQTAKVALVGGEAWSTTRRWFDSAGQLRRVQEPAGAGGAPLVTTLSYDVSGALTRLVSGSSPAQVRSFTYDNRGFLLSETLPEKGIQGNGSVIYRDYDPSGLPHRKIDGPSDLAYTYDFMGRLLTVRDRNHANRLVTELEYDQGAGSGAGRLWRSTQHNWVDLPWTSPGAEDLRVHSTLSYLGATGALSAKETRFHWGAKQVGFTQGYHYDGNGAISRIDYPVCDAAACVGAVAGSSRPVSFTYSEGLLTGVPGFVNEIAYHPSGTWKRVVHANGVTDHRNVHPSLTGVTQRIRTTGLAENFDSGVMAYDGVGNIKSMGSDAFSYDHVSRLTSANSPSLAWSPMSFQYDEFGNLTAQNGVLEGGQGVTLSVDRSTNRLTGPGIAYDAAGNMTQWGSVAYAYDTSNRMTGGAHMRYIYDADGERVGSFVGAPGGRGFTFTLRGPGNRILSKIALDDLSGVYSLERDYIHAAGRLLASRVDPSQAGDIRHYHLDHLGSPRRVSATDGSSVYAQHFLPFGHEAWGEDIRDNVKYTDHERDFSTGLDAMHARHYSRFQGRFLSVDRLRGRASDPQSLNRYAYVLNNPLRYHDPTGRSESEANGELEIPPPLSWVVNWEHGVIASVASAGAVVGGLSGDLVTGVFGFVVPGLRDQVTSEFGDWWLPMTHHTIFEVTPAIWGALFHIEESAGELPVVVAPALVGDHAPVAITLSDEPGPDAGPLFISDITVTGQMPPGQQVPHTRTRVRSFVFRTSVSMTTTDS